ncbi:MBL fold metallo-hydrolase [Thalassomonas viridans]|uniref:MBL fold metallo-hydrolase n=1 Tax=Thalassomonas viridans TaxID=137584 RepID=A0AAE9Z9H9_9GAMM|nr:MBL fold metallo-hydrolase [Thalassomonas viridans]WDE09018.1 MBL fold metallo-hydrolase [Thalassomonas viridans]
MKQVLLAGLILISSGCSSSQTLDARASNAEPPRIAPSSLQQKKWLHGSADCQADSGPALDVFRYDAASYILRQNKCLSFEAPFIYVLFGQEKVLVLDTGATKSGQEFPLYDTVQELIQKQSALDGKTGREILVIHSHNHSDHYSGDVQFRGKANVTLIEPNFAAMSEFFNFNRWPDGQASIELGERTVTVIPTPGHQEEAITLYDPKTKWLLTGDTFYPGYLYVKHWQDYKKSIARLTAFSQNHEVSAILGAHIEMKDKAGEYYPIGTTYQPNEAPLPLQPQDLSALHQALNKTEQPTKIIMNNFILAPMSSWQKALSNMARWISQ